MGPVACYALTVVAACPVTGIAGVITNATMIAFVGSQLADDDKVVADYCEVQVS